MYIRVRPPCSLSAHCTLADGWEALHTIRSVCLVGHRSSVRRGCITNVPSVDRPSPLDDVIPSVMAVCTEVGGVVGRVHRGSTVWGGKGVLFTCTGAIGSQRSPLRALRQFVAHALG